MVESLTLDTGVRVPPDQITYLLVAVVAAGVALGLLLLAALITRRRRIAEERRAATRFVAREPTFEEEAGPSGGSLPWLGPSAARPQEAAGTRFAAPPGPPAPVVLSAEPGPPPAPVGPGPEPGPPGRDAGVTAPPPTEVPEPAMPMPDTLPAAGDREGGVAAAAVESEAGRRFTVGERLSDRRAEEPIDAFLDVNPRRPPAEGPLPDLYVDPLTGLDTPLAWDKDLAEETARFVRYRRPICVVVAELDGLSRLMERFGPDPARRVLPAVGDALRRNARRSDRVAHVGNGRFLALLPETDEIQAINYIERVRAACDRWLESGAVALHLAIGWASPTAVGELSTALRTAEERMYQERRRGGGPGAGDPGASR
jgi:diguanylate cyclase (GGDEF)-like protein